MDRQIKTTIKTSECGKFCSSECWAFSLTICDYRVPFCKIFGTLEPVEGLLEYQKSYSFEDLMKAEIHRLAVCMKREVKG